MADYISREAAVKLLTSIALEVPDSKSRTVAKCINKIELMPPADVEPVRRGRWIHSRKHLWYKNENGEIDMWRLDVGFHNGPECQVCHASFCVYCTPNFDDEECDAGHYYCSECKAAQLDNHNTYCPNCGAKMDLEVENDG